MVDLKRMSETGFSWPSRPYKATQAQINEVRRVRTASTRKAEKILLKYLITMEYAFPPEIQEAVDFLRCTIPRTGRSRETSDFQKVKFYFWSCPLGEISEAQVFQDLKMGRKEIAKALIKLKGLNYKMDVTLNEEKESYFVGPEGRPDKISAPKDWRLFQNNKFIEGSVVQQLVDSIPEKYRLENIKGKIVNGKPQYLSLDDL